MSLLVLLLITMGIVDLGRAVYARNAIVNAAREGARYGVTHPTDTTGITARATALLVGLDSSLVVVEVTRPDSLHVQVTVRYTFHPVSAMIAQYADGGTGAGIVMRGRSLMRTEA